MMRNLVTNIFFSYKTYGRLLLRTFFRTGRTPARLSVRRLAVMIVFLPLLLLLQTVHWLALIADEVLFPGYRRVEIRRPLFIVGVPRSGTTFLHRVMSADTERFTTFSLWELILAPSILQRKIIRGLGRADAWAGSPLKRLLNRLERMALGGLDDIHRISLADPEEDYFVLAPIYACFLLILPFPFFDELGYLAFFDDEAGEADKKRIMTFYRACLRRHLYVHGADKIFLSKNVSFGPMVATLSRYFPDSRLIGTVRDPLSAVPSHISSMMEGAALFDNDVQGDTFRDQLIAVQRYAYTHLADILPGLPEERRIIVRMEDLKNGLEAQIKEIYDRFGYRMGTDFAAYLRQEGRRQKRYKSGHYYNPADYGLSDNDIAERFHDVYQRFGYPPPPAARAVEKEKPEDGVIST